MSKCEWCGEPSRGTAIQDAAPYAVRLSCGNHGTDFTPNATEYPDWLVRRVAAAAARGVDDTADLYGTNEVTGNPWSVDYIREWEAGARAVLDALGFERRRVKGVLIGDGRYVSYGGFERPDAKWYSKWEAATEWKEVTDGNE